MTTPIRVLRSPVIPAGFVHGFPDFTAIISTPDANSTMLVNMPSVSIDISSTRK